MAAKNADESGTHELRLARRGGNGKTKLAVPTTAGKPEFLSSRFHPLEADVQKEALFREITAQLKVSLATLHAAARTAHGEAIHESSRADNKYDTRGLEAGYLAEGQARLARQVAEAIQVYTNLEAFDFAAGDPITVGALVRVEIAGAPAIYFLGPKGGGLEVACEGERVVVITPQSPLGQAIKGKKTGDTWTAAVGGTLTKHRIVSVQ